MGDEHPVINTKRLSKDFGTVTAVSDFNLTVNKGELFGLVGPDGAGKTTVLRMLAGILELSSGEAWIDGISVREKPDMIKEHIAYMPQRFGLYQDLTVIENLIFYADLFRVPKKKRGARIEQLFGFSRLGPFKDRLAGALSGGMKQKLGLACALIHSPRLLLLDEPTNGVDPVSRRDFWKILYDLIKEGISVLVSTAYLDEAERTNQLALMHLGSIIQMGSPEFLKAGVSGAIFEITTSDLKSCKKTLSKLPDVIDVNSFGDSLHLRVNNDKDIMSLKKQLEMRGIHIISSRKIAPSMEDAFLSLIGGHKNESDMGMTVE
jgi:ABC-2 type transport system ATP-binding protein